MCSLPLDYDKIDTSKPYTLLVSFKNHHDEGAQENYELFSIDQYDKVIY